MSAEKKQFYHNERIPSTCLNIYTYMQWSEHGPAVAAESERLPKNNAPPNAGSGARDVRDRYHARASFQD